MMIGKLNIERTRDLLQGFDFQKLFIEELGWSQPASRQILSLAVEKDEFTGRQIAQLSGVVVFEVIAKDGKMPPAKVRAALHKEISRHHHENLLIFLEQERTSSLWYWVKREGNKSFAREHLYIKGQPGDLFLSKLGAMVVDISELDADGALPVTEVASRLKKALDIERVTKKFYREFSEQHLAFIDLIEGIADDRQRHWYASILLNRLMFVYFLQKKGFVEKGKLDYLQDKLVQSKKDFGKDRFYRDFLWPLFFEGFAKPENERSADTKKLLGSIKYLNGGLFLPHAVETTNPDIRIPDRAFENLFGLFERYSWNLNDTPAGKDDEINPDVLGYIFEKYINQKAFGAYYTRPEITEYLCERTIYKLVLDKINTPGIEGVRAARKYDSMAELLLSLDAELCRELLHTVLPKLSLLDPACGSGAFLVAAMKTLINLYAAVIGKIEFLGDRNLTEWLRKEKAEHKSINYFIKKKIITDNLYGVDIMEEATEIAKLRLFLALVAAAQSVDELEPLPNIDFNILAGNSLIGLLHVDPTQFDTLTATAQSKLL
ncbi:MAG: ATP-binding protein, partial [Desulfuromonadales bacterium]|nr:ATP-binding protein [Desulfuromonadales bacterium]